LWQVEFCGAKKTKQKCVLTMENLSDVDNHVTIDLTKDDDSVDNFGECLLWQATCASVHVN